MPYLGGLNRFRFDIDHRWFCKITPDAAVCCMWIKNQSLPMKLHLLNVNAKVDCSSYISILFADKVTVIWEINECLNSKICKCII